MEITIIMRDSRKNLKERMQEFNDFLDSSISQIYLQCAPQADLWHCRNLHSETVDLATIDDYLQCFKYLPSNKLILYAY